MYTATVTVRFPDFVSNAIMHAKRSRTKPKITYTGKPPAKTDQWYTEGTTSAKIVTEHETVRAAFDWIRWVISGNGGNGTIYMGHQQLCYFDRGITQWYADGYHRWETWA